MRHRFVIVLVAFGITFASGWLFANEVRPPRLEDIGLAMWAVLAIVGLLSAVVATQGRG